MSAIGCLNASSNPELHFYKLYSDKLPNYYNKQLNSNGFRIVHLSDIHIANNISKDKVEKLVAQVNSLNPDVVLITGDIIDGCYELIKEQVGELAKLHSKYGVYGITGNHEYYSDFENWKEKFSQININLLENDSVTLWDGHRQIINIAGVNDNQALKVKGKNFEGTDFQKALKNVVNTVPTVVMVHKPAEFINVMNYDVFLTLSGHTHGGMVPILKNLVKVFNKGFVSGFYEEKNHKLIVSNGTFLWSGFYSRINTPGEIIIIDIFKK
ncbi:MAG: metallophosphoesterase [Succinivibrionaceae bacterium]